MHCQPIDSGTSLGVTVPEFYLDEDTPSACVFCFPVCQPAGSDMNAASLREHLGRLDAALHEPTHLCIYGSAALMLMGEEDRFSVDVDVAGPYSTVNESALAAAAAQIGRAPRRSDPVPAGVAMRLRHR